MRKFLLLSICLAVSTLAGAKDPFAIFEDAAPYENEIRNPLWKTILQEKPITLKLALPKSEKNNRNKWYDQITRSFNAWFEYPAQVIRQSGRAEEFADILPVLEKGLLFGPNGFETTVVFLKTAQEIDEECSVGSYGCADMEKYIIYVPTETALKDQRDKYRPGTPLLSYSRTFAHEFGHQLGFVDQYLEYGLVNYVEDVLPQGHSSQRHVTETIMSFSGYSQKMGCDDVDAMINMIDLQRGGAQGKRKGVVWKSFCLASPDRFRDGKLTAGYAYRIRKDIEDPGLGWKIDLGDGKLMNIKIFPASLFGINPREEADKKGEITKKDALNRPLLEKLAEKEVVYYEYFQGIVRRAAYVQTPAFMDLLVWVEEIYPSIEDPNKLVHVLHHNKDGDEFEDPYEELETWTTENIDNIPM